MVITAKFMYVKKYTSAAIVILPANGCACPVERSKKITNKNYQPQQQRKLVGICYGMIKCIELLYVAVNQRH
jgi:hypothetical protein